jgi:hypothetical protein
MVSSDFKRYFIFPDGSYWVYKNQFGEFDTLIIKSHSSIFVEDAGPESCSENEFIECKYEESKTSLKFVANIRAWHNIISTFYDNNSFFPEFVSDTSESSYQGEKYFYRQDFISEMVVQGKKYRDRKSTRLNSSHPSRSRMPSSA